MGIDRVENWKRFSSHMEDYIQKKTVKKYDVTTSKTKSFDLMSVTEPIICVWNILKYSLRIWNGNMKDHDIEKIAHYAELAWTLSKGSDVKALSSRYYKQID